MAILAAGKIYLATVIFNGLNTIQGTVEGWVDTAFANENLRKTFHVLETLVSAELLKNLYFLSISHVV